MFLFQAKEAFFLLKNADTFYVDAFDLICFLLMFLIRKYQVEAGLFLCYRKLWSYYKAYCCIENSTLVKYYKTKNLKDEVLY